MEKNRFQGDLTMAFKYLKRTYKQEGEQLFTQIDSDWKKALDKKKKDKI